MQRLRLLRGLSIIHGCRLVTQQVRLRARTRLSVRTSTVPLARVLGDPGRMEEGERRARARRCEAACRGVCPAGREFAVPSAGEAQRLTSACRACAASASLFPKQF